MEYYVNMETCLKFDKDLEKSVMLAYPPPHKKQCFITALSIRDYSDYH